MRDHRRAFMRPSHTLRDVMACLDQTAFGIVLVVDDAERLQFVVTDGDVRRAILHGLGLDTRLEQWARQRREQGLQPTTAPIGLDDAAIVERIERAGVRHMPLVDSENRVVGLATLDDFVAKAPGLSALLMAGGEGQRLRPLTEQMPKPMVPVGDRPLMEHIVDQLRDAGISSVSVATHYKAEQIVDHFGDGSRFGVSITYVNESQPLGTAGALGLAAPWTSTLLVMNGDILTRVNYRAMLQFHRDHQALLTVAVRQHHVVVPYGVVDTSGVDVCGLREKPEMQFFVNAGIYMLESAVRDVVRPGERLDMTDVIARLIAGGGRVVSFPICEYWIDIGQQESYAQAKADVAQGVVGK